MSASLSRTVAPLGSTLNATVRVPGSKSVAARALVCAAMATGESTVSNLPSGDDTASMLRGLATLGAQIDVHGDTAKFTASWDV
ncbi:MAG: hypothetical protein JZU63_06465, partial [Rhodoferax sp.]|nr:hypothetical protein [Rhodoferax sp.]